MYDQVYNEDYKCETCSNENCPIKICIPQFSSIVRQQIRAFNVKRKGIIFRQNEWASGIYFLKEGKVKEVLKTTDPRENILEFCGNGEVLGLRGLGDQGTYPIGIKAIEDSSLCFIDRTTFQELAGSCSKFSLKVMDLFADKLKKSDQKVQKMARKSLKQRIANSLIDFWEKFGSSGKQGWLNLKLSRKEIADYSGTAPEVVSRMLASFVKAELIELDGRNIKITNIRGLQKLAGI